MKLTHVSETQGEKPYHRRSVDASSREFSYSPERLSSMKIATSPSEVGHNGQSYYKTSAGGTPSRAPGNYNHLSDQTDLSRPPRMPPSDRYLNSHRTFLGESSASSNGLADLRRAGQELEQASFNLRSLLDSPCQLVYRVPTF